jgi:hypothetical protein
MKKLSGSIKTVGLVAVAVITAVTLRGFAQSTPAPNETEPPMPPESQEKFVLKIKHRHPLKDSSKAGEDAFKALLNNGKYGAGTGNKVHLRHSKAQDKDEYLPAGAGTSAKLEIQTDKVTVSETAKDIEAGGLTLIQPHVTIQVASKSPADIKAVLDLLAP